MKNRKNERYMMKKMFFIIGILLYVSGVSAQSFKEDFQKALNSNEMGKAEQILKSWDYADANDAELYVAYFNFFTQKSFEKDSIHPDKENAKKAIEFISEGITRFPTRFDMRIVKIYMYDRMKEYKPFTDEIVNLVNYSKKIDNQWKGENFTLINEPEKMFYGAVQDFQGLLLAAQDTSLLKNMIRISETMTKNYPEHTQSWLNLSTVYIMQKKYDASLEALKKAEKSKPNDAIVLYNLAYIYGKKGDKINEKKYYEKTVQNADDNEQKLKQAAQKQLDAINGKK